MAVQPIAICGMGAMTPYGCGADAFWQGIVRGASAISTMDLFDIGGLACTKAGVIRRDAPSLPVFERAPRALRFAAAACREALQQAGIFGNAAALARTALVTGSNFGSMDAGEASLIPTDLPDCNPGAAAQLPASAPALALANGFGLGGPRVPLSLSCASGAAAAAAAAELIRSGAADRVLAVGFDALSRFAWCGLCSLHTMTRELVRPFDARRGGTIFSEGAGAVVLESAASCLARQARPLAWLNGWATGNNGHHLTAPSPRGAGSRFVMSEALRMAGFAPERVDHINAHGTGTHANDSSESDAIADVFGARASSIPVTSVKGALGHALGAAGALELIASAMTLRRGLIPPTANYVEPDPACPVNVVTAPLKGGFGCVLSNSAGLGGCNAALVITRADAFSGAAAPDAAPVPAPAVPDVVITGRGLASALGEDADEAADAWREGETACAPLSRFSIPGAGDPPLCGEAREPDLEACGVSPKPYLDTSSRLMLAACGEALSDADEEDEPAGEDAGVSAGTAWGSCETAALFYEGISRKGPRFARPFLFPHTYSNTAASLAAIEWSHKGAHGNYAAPGIASGLAFADAVTAIREGRAKRMLAAGADALSPQRFFAEVKPHGVFARVPGEAGAAIALETAERAKARGVPVLAHVRGVAVAADAEKAIARALKQAHLEARGVAAWLSDPVARGAVDALRGAAPCKVPEELCGDTAGAAFLVEAALALVELKRSGGPVIVVAADGCGAVAAALSA